MERSTKKPDLAPGERTHTVIAADVVVRGDIEGPTDLHVQGRVTGAVSVTGLIVDDRAEVDGPVTAEAVVIGGRVNGTVDAQAVHLKATARVEGDVSYASLQIEAGARLLGRCLAVDEVEAGAKPTEAAIAPKSSRPDPVESGQDLIRMAARLRRAAE